MIAASAFAWWPISVTEVLGFVTGGVCVLLTVRESIWNWPIGLANNVLFFVLFFRGRLFADMALQAVYFALGVYGWLTWLRGGSWAGPLPVTRTRPWEWAVLPCFVLGGTIVLREVLLVVNGAAPLWDALTTVLSLAAQYLMCRKRFEHWFFWIAADVIYIPLYMSRTLHLTALLYAVFLVMCLFGVRAWRRSLTASSVGTL
jgi:nicotinamide mononucleotide transporter